MNAELDEVNNLLRIAQDEKNSLSQKVTAAEAESRQLKERI